MTASFYIDQFEKLIKDQGYNISWEQAIVCECNTQEQPDIHCNLCKGSGYRYLPSKAIKALTTSLSGQFELKIQGMNEPGTAYVTPQMDVIMGFHDRLEFVDIVCKFSQALTMGNRITSSTYREIKQVLFVLIDNNIYEENIDFIISEDRFHLEWIDEKSKPVKGSRISILYLTTPTYLVYDMSHELRSTTEHKGTQQPYTVELPKQYLIKRENFIYGKNVNEKKEIVPTDDGGWTYG